MNAVRRQRDANRFATTRQADTPALVTKVTDKIPATLTFVLVSTKKVLIGALILNNFM